MRGAKEWMKRNGALKASMLIAKLNEKLRGCRQYYAASDNPPEAESCLGAVKRLPEFIHPFADGNGRMGRMWQILLLYHWKEIFAWLPVESIIQEHQEEYYSALGHSNDAMDSTAFIEFMLWSIWATLERYATTDQDTDQVTDQVKRLMSVLGAKTLSAAELMELLELKHRPTFRKNYLHPALEHGLIEMTLPDTSNSRNQRYRRKRGQK
ncbi:MAG: Fic family protein [Clostridiales bacterium]|jgi:hypothetical protein|nr:Fic family protein [Clostridiales bacterium]